MCLRYQTYVIESWNSETGLKLGSFPFITLRLTRIFSFVNRFLRNWKKKLSFYKKVLTKKKSCVNVATPTRATKTKAKPGSNTKYKATIQLGLVTARRVAERSEESLTTKRG